MMVQFEFCVRCVDECLLCLKRLAGVGQPFLRNRTSEKEQKLTYGQETKG